MPKPPYGSGMTTLEQGPLRPCAAIAGDQRWLRPDAEHRLSWARPVVSARFRDWIMVNAVTRLFTFDLLLASPRRWSC